MGTPVGFRTVHPPLSSVGRFGFPAEAGLSRLQPPALPGVEDLAAPAPVGRITLDHLALIRALVEAGKYSRALELLDAVFQPGNDHEQCWYLRLWAMTGQGKEGEALHLVRSLLPRLPGSAALAYLQAALECAQNQTGPALESARRALETAPDRPEPAALLATLTGAPSNDGEPAGVPRRPEGPVLVAVRPDGFSPLAAALQGAALLHPAGSSRPLIPLRPRPIRQPDRLPTRPAPHWRRFNLFVLAIAVAAVWAIPDPVPAALVLAAVVVLVARGIPSPIRR